MCTQDCFALMFQPGSAARDGETVDYTTIETSSIECPHPSFANTDVLKGCFTMFTEVCLSSARRSCNLRSNFLLWLSHSHDG